MRGGLGRQRQRCVAAWTLGVTVCVCVARPVAAPAQQASSRWNDAPARALVALAIERRRRQLADTGMTDYQAMAHGYVTFLAQVGPGFPEAPRLVRSDELAVEVYWHAPGLSKQRIVGRRDTLLLPADIDYYRDRFGIIQNNFPDSIGLGENNDVRDVPHPLAPSGPEDYDYRLTDSLRIGIPGRTVGVYAVAVRPRTPDAPRVVGTVYLERETGALVRMTLTFTRAAILDHRIETLAVTLDNALVDRRFWLPHHQTLEVVRTAAWLDFPVRGIIRGRWQVCCYEINRGLAPTVFDGPEIAAAPQAVLDAYPWHGRVLDSLPSDVAVATVDDVRRVGEQARAVVGTAVLSRVRGAALAGRGLSDFVRINRVEGLALGGGASRSLGPDWSLSARARYGVDDRQGKAEIGLRWQSPGASGVDAALFGFRSYRDAGDLPEGSTLLNSIAARAFGADHTDPFDARGAGLTVGLGERLGAQWAVTATRETQRPLAVHARPNIGRYAPTIPALPLQATRVALSLERPRSMGLWGIGWRARGEVRGEWFTAADAALPGGAVGLGRGFAELEADRAFGSDRLVLRAAAGTVAAGGPIPAQDLVYAGGDVTGPGYPYHAFVARTVGQSRAEWRFPVPLPSLALGRYGRTPARGIVAPFLSADYVGRPALPPASLVAAARTTGKGWYPALGVSALVFFDVVRLDVARGLRRPGCWTFWIDATPDLWGIL